MSPLLVSICFIWVHPRPLGRQEKGQLKPAIWPAEMLRTRNIDAPSFPERWRMQPVRLPNLYGELYLPPACPEQSPDAVPINSPTFHEEVGRFTRPRPGLVVAPSSAGICDVRERHYARYFSDAGFVCLVVDCFTPRGLKQCADDQSRLSAREMNRDLLAGWNLLAGRADTDADRIAVLGVSRGAGAALDMAMHLPFSACGHERFAAHVAISPPASIQPRRPVTTGAPILMLIGGQDDFTGTEPALRYADRLKTGRGRHHRTRLSGSPSRLGILRQAALLSTGSMLSGLPFSSGGRRFLYRRTYRGKHVRN